MTARAYNDRHEIRGGAWCVCGCPIWRGSVWEDSETRRLSFERRDRCRACNLAALPSSLVTDNKKNTDGDLSVSVRRVVAKEIHDQHQTTRNAANVWCFTEPCDCSRRPGGYCDVCADIVIGVADARIGHTVPKILGGFVSAYIRKAP